MFHSNNMKNWKEIRNDFPVLENQVYLQTQGGGPISLSLIEETTKRLTELSLNGSEICNEWDIEVERTRENLAKLLNTNSDNLAFIPSTSFAMNTLAYSLNNDYRLLTFKDDFPNSSLPWLNKGYEVDFVKSKSNGYISIEDITNTIRPDTKVIITSHVMYRTGFRQDLKRIGELCQEKNIILIVDATQAFGVFDIDVKELNIDVLVFHAYKWVNAGFGIGGMYASDKIAKKFKKPFLGFTSVNYLSKPHDTSNYEVKNIAAAYELGRTPYLNILMLGFMIEKINSIGLINIKNRVLGLVEYCLQKCRENSIDIISDFEFLNLSGIVNIKAYGINSADLKSESIIARSDTDSITIGIHYYNEKEDIDRLIEAINKKRRDYNNV